MRYLPACGKMTIRVSQFFNCSTQKFHISNYADCHITEKELCEIGRAVQSFQWPKSLQMKVSYCFFAKIVASSVCSPAANGCRKKAPLNLEDRGNDGWVVTRVINQKTGT